MRFLIVGAGGVGGYFGGRLIEKGEDVTFLVRQNRKTQLKTAGLVIKSSHGNFQTDVKAICTGEEKKPFDVVIITVKAYHLAQVITDIAPYVGENTMIIPLVNGYIHYETLHQAFGKEKILGGLCFIETTINDQAEIVQTSNSHDFIFGEWDGSKTERVTLLAEHIRGTKFNSVLSEKIYSDVWNKYIFIATMSGVTTLMRSPIGPIITDENGQTVCKRLLAEIVLIVRDYDQTVQEDIAELTLHKLQSIEFLMKSSMQRDMENNRNVEVEHFHGFLLNLAEKQGKDRNDFPILTTVYSNLKIYESLL
ncbi:ketopantoate reductase family protein [Bacillaceae bacterium IKA-2]|nr:ketopantoate reductase family protein [Bacillaceae bacterium IKA-2]